MKKRQWTYYVYLFQSIFIGFELTIVQASLLQYLQTSIQSAHEVKLYYDLINAVVYVCPVLFGSIIARWTDSTRDVRSTLIFLNVLVFVGTVVYMLPFSPLFKLAGRFLHGFHFVIRSIMYSELSRMFCEEEVHQKIPAFLTALSLGYCMGPVSNMVFVKVDVWVGGLHVTYGNSASLPLLLLSILQISLLIFCTHNVSREYDVKSEETQVQRILSNTGTEGEGRSLVQRFRDMLCADYLLLLAMSFHSGFGITLFPRIIPLVVERLALDQDVVNFSYLGFGVAGTFISLILVKLKLSSNELFGSGYASLLSLWFTLTALQLACLDMPAWLKDASVKYLLTISVLSWSFFNATTKTFLIVTCAKFVSSSNQSLGESVRANVTMLGRILTALGTTFVYDNLLVFSACNFCITFFFLTAMTVKKKTLSAPTTCF